MHLIIGKGNEEIAAFPNIALDILQKSREAHVFSNHLHISAQSLSNMLMSVFFIYLKDSFLLKSMYFENTSKHVFA